MRMIDTQTDSVAIYILLSAYSLTACQILVFASRNVSVHVLAFLLFYVKWQTHLAGLPLLTILAKAFFNYGWASLSII